VNAEDAVGCALVGGEEFWAVDALAIEALAVDALAVDALAVDAFAVDAFAIEVLAGAVFAADEFCTTDALADWRGPDASSAEMVVGAWSVWLWAVEKVDADAATPAKTVTAAAAAIAT
jgi:hypothetical protein